MLHVHLSVSDRNIVHATQDSIALLESALTAAEDEELLIGDEEYGKLIGEYAKELLSESAETAFARR